MVKLSRRKALLGLGTTTASASLLAASTHQAFSASTPNIIATPKKINWKLTSSFPKSLDTIYGTAEYMAKLVDKMTDGNFKISVFAAGELAPTMGALDVTSNGAVEACHTTAYYYVGKNEAFALASCIPFGLNARQQIGWLNYGGGNELLAPLFKSYNVVGFPCGNTGAQMGGWLRKEIKTVDDIKGLKIRIGGLAGEVFAKLGAVPQQIPGTDIYPALEKGVIEGAEWVGPYDDEKLGFHKVAPYYYYPGWWEGGPAIHSFFNMDAYNKLPENYKTILQAACAQSTLYMSAKYDMLNPEALKRIVASGTKLKKYPTELLEKFYQASQQVYAEISEKNTIFKDIFTHQENYKKETALWLRFSDAHFDHFMMNHPLKEIF